MYGADSSTKSMRKAEAQGDPSESDKLGAKKTPCVQTASRKGTRRKNAPNLRWMSKIALASTAASPATQQLAAQKEKPNSRL